MGLGAGFFAAFFFGAAFLAAFFAGLRAAFLAVARFADPDRLRPAALPAFFEAFRRFAIRHPSDG
jgi:hypothetical protein